MANSEIAWVIQRNDGMYLVKKDCWSVRIRDAFQNTREEIQYVMNKCELNENCKPVKIKIEVCDEQ